VNTPPTIPIQQLQLADVDGDEFLAAIVIFGEDGSIVIDFSDEDDEPRLILSLCHHEAQAFGSWLIHAAGRAAGIPGAHGAGEKSKLRPVTD
jgi:hypothetical protein